MRALKVGDVVTLKVDCLGNVAGTEGVVYEVYKLAKDAEGVSVIFENGAYDGFSEKEQAGMLSRTGHEPTLAEYKFKNVIQLTKDYESGVFETVLG